MSPFAGLNRRVSIAGTLCHGLQTPGEGGQVALRSVATCFGVTLDGFDPKRAVT
jgi:hypothetical protein